MLFLSYGYSDKLVSKCVYFVRNVDGPVDGNVSDNSDAALLFGEVGDYRTLLDSLSILVSEVCLQRMEIEKDWGEAPEPQVKQLISDVAGFAQSIDDSMRGMVGATVVLAKPNKKVDIDQMLQLAATSKPVPIEVLRHFEGNLWFCTRF